MDLFQLTVHCTLFKLAGRLAGRHLRLSERGQPREPAKVSKKEWLLSWQTPNVEMQ